MIFSLTLEIKETLAIGRKLPGSVGSSPARLMTGIRIDLFWSNGMTPSTMDRLQIVVRNGSKVSRCSCRRNVSKGPSSHDFGAAAMMMRRSSAGVIAITADRMQVVDGNVGGGEPAVPEMHISTWFQANFLSLNPNKSCYIIFTGPI